jgi:pantetheine-phosphate adenylyltransferase
MKEKIAIFPGSFDPYTKGHEDIVLRGLQIFDKIIIAIGYNSSKHNRYFDVELMVDKIRQLHRSDERISIEVYNELTAVFAKKHRADYLLRGLRNTTDFEYENSIAQVNMHLVEHLETVFLITSPKYAHISSTIIREVHQYNGDISNLIPYQLAAKNS